MPIIKHVKGLNNPEDNLLYFYPDPLATEATKSTEDYIKNTNDYFYNIGIKGYAAQHEEISDNYNLVKGILKRRHFYEKEEVKSFTEVLLQTQDLPSYVKHYSILTPPINTLIGEMSKRPDNIYVKAFDEDSQSEEMQFKTTILQEFIIQNAQQKIAAQLAQQGEDIDAEELEALTMEEVQDQLTSYTSEAEMWGSAVMEYLKVRLGMKEKSEDAFRDLLISGREFFHIYEDNTEIGFNIEVLNPKNVWYLNTPDQEYSSNPLDKTDGDYAVGIIRVMELSEIIHKFKLTEEEIRYLRELPQENALISTRESNLVNPQAHGEGSIHYNTYNPLILQERLLMESELLTNDSSDVISDFFGVTSNTGTFGYKFIVNEFYHCTKKKIGNLTFVNQDNRPESMLVDENYKEGSHPMELSIEWTWINQWYKGMRIAKDIYYYEPFDLLDYCPIIGVRFENKNAPIRSLVDQMKPFQMLYNVAMNQLFRLLEKDMGVVFLMSHRHVPIPKDGDYQDAVEIWETEAREKGWIWVDDSPENLKSPSSFNQMARVDLSRINEIQGRYTLAVEMRNECWKLVGLSEQRLGESKATETATGINTSLTQSYAQTEPWFAKHGYLINKVYQALLDAALYIESSKPMSTIPYVTSEGEHAFAQINGTSLKLKEMGVLVTDRSEDAQNLQQLKNLAQSMLQNGASHFDVANMWFSKSTRYIKDTFKRLQQKAEDFQRRQQALEEAQLQQDQQQFQQSQQLLALQQEKQMAFEAYEAEKERINKREIAWINQSSKNGQPADTNSSEYLNIQNEASRNHMDYTLKLQDLQARQQNLLLQQYGAAEDRKLQKEKLQVEREKIQATKDVARMNKNKYDGKPKTKKK